MGDTPDYSSSSVYTNDVLSINIAGFGNALAVGDHIDLSLAAYGSFIVICNAGVPQILTFDFHQAITYGGVGDTVGYPEYVSNIDTAVTAEFHLPVRGGSVRITNSSSAPINLITYGSNRLTGVARVLGGNWGPRTFGYTGAITSGTPVLMSNVDNGPDSLAMNGQCNFRAATSSVSAYVGYRVMTRLGGTRDVLFALIPTGGSLFGLMSFPVGISRPMIVPAGTAASNTFSLDVTPTTN